MLLMIWRQSPELLPAQNSSLDDPLKGRYGFVLLVWIWDMLIFQYLFFLFQEAALLDVKQLFSDWIILVYFVGYYLIWNYFSPQNIVFKSSFSTQISLNTSSLTKRY